LGVGKVDEVENALGRKDKKVCTKRGGLDLEGRQG